MKHRNLLISFSCRILFWPIVFLSLYLFYRGHHQPGGGFIAGLTLVTAFLLRAVDVGISATKKLGLRTFSFGLLVALASGLISLWEGKPLFTGMWTAGLGTPILFDLGVFLVVAGQMSFIFSMVLELGGFEK